MFPSTVSLLPFHLTLVVWIAPLVSAVYLYLLCLALKPLFNALPALEQRAGVIYASFSVTSALLLLGLPTTDGQRAVPRSLRSTFLCGAAVAASLAAIGNRYVATFATHASPAYITGGKVPYLDELTDVLAPQFAALATLVFLGVGVVVPLLAVSLNGKCGLTQACIPTEASGRRPKGAPCSWHGPLAPIRHDVSVRRHDGPV